MDAFPTLATSLAAKKAEGKKLFIPYIMGGLFDGWELLVDILATEGADAIEVGIPFSDPMIDGAVIQEAALRALQRGTTPHSVLTDVESPPIPLVMMTYYNLVLREGHERMAHRLRSTGFSGVILPDLPLEELGPWSKAADAEGIATVMLVAPSTSDDRLRSICERSRGFVYAVARMGVTGERTSESSDVGLVVDRIKAVTTLPVCVGIGISTPEQAVSACASADGVVVGSALVRRAMEGGVEAVRGFAREIRNALD